MTIKLWGRATSSNVMKAMWLLEELKLPYDRMDVGGVFGRTDTPTYRAMHPLGLVPSLEEDGGFTLFESNAILRYLCNAYSPASSIYPRAPRARAEVDALLDFQQTALFRPQTTVFRNLVRMTPERIDHQALAEATAETARIWAILDCRLSRRSYLTGEDFTIADIATGVHVHRWFVMPVPGRPAAPNLEAWYRRLLERTAFKAHCAGVPA